MILTYKCLIHCPSPGLYYLSIPEYPTFTMQSDDIMDLMERAKTEVPEYIRLKACSLHHFVPPDRSTKNDMMSKVGVLVFAITVELPNTVDDERLIRQIKLPSGTIERAKAIVRDHPDLESTSHFFTWCVEHMVNQLTEQRSIEEDDDL